MQDVAITEKYNIFLDWALTAGLSNILNHGQSFDSKMGPDTRIGVMPRYGDADSIKWFPVKPNFAFHVLNSFDDGDEAVLHAMSMRVPLITPPEQGIDPSIDTRHWIT